MKVIIMDIADKVKYIRNNVLNQTQETFASKIGVTRSTIKNWENGSSYPTVSHLLMIAITGEVSLDYLIFNDSELQLSLSGIDDIQYNLIKSLIAYFQKKTIGDLYDEI